MWQNSKRIFVILLALALARPLDAQRVGAGTSSLRDTLIAIVLDMYAGWAPQAGTLESAIPRSRKYFVRDSTFAMIIDTTYRSAYEQWEARTAVSIPRAHADYREQRPYITNAKVLAIGDRAAVLTLTYCEEFVKRDGSTGLLVNSGATVAFVRQPEGWRIAHYHGTHGPEFVTPDKCSTRYPGLRRGAE